jgi:hypothetical protein
VKTTSETAFSEEEAHASRKEKGNLMAGYDTATVADKDMV